MEATNNSAQLYDEMVEKQEREDERERLLTIHHVDIKVSRRLSVALSLLLFAKEYLVLLYLMVASLPPLFFSEYIM